MKPILSESLKASDRRAPARIMIVEDNPDNRALYHAYLDAEGFQVGAFPDGELALAAIRDFRPDLILLDVVLPGIDGFEVCRRIRELPEISTTPVIVVTTLEDIASRMEAFESNADEFLSKPINRGELMARVRSMLRLRRALNTVARHEQERMRMLLERYLSKQVTERLLELSDVQRSELLAHKERVDCAIVFTDIRGFTAMSESLEPGDVVDILNEHLSALVNRAFESMGTVFNMTGDGLMLGFGVPIENPDIVGSALDCCIKIQTDFIALARKVREAYGLQIGLGAGANFGPVIVGNVGSEKYLTYTAIGDTVNVASRLQTLAVPGSVVVSTSVRDRAGSRLNDFAEEELPGTTLRGKVEPTTFYRYQICDQFG